MYSATLGYARNFPLVPFLETGMGADVTLYRFTERLDTVYSKHPVSFHAFLRIGFEFGGMGALRGGRRASTTPLRAGVGLPELLDVKGELSAHPPGHGVGIAREHHRPDPHALEHPEGFSRFRSDEVGQRDRPLNYAVHEHVDDRLSLFGGAFELLIGGSRRPAPSRSRG